MRIVSISDTPKAMSTAADKTPPEVLPKKAYQGYHGLWPVRFFKIERYSTKTTLIRGTKWNGISTLLKSGQKQIAT